MKSIELAFVEFVIGILGVVITSTTSTVPQYTQFAWAGGILTWVMFALLFGNVFELKIVPALCISSGISFALMVGLYSPVAIFLFFVFIILIFLMVLYWVWMEDQERRNSW
jgi:hypothetical protein